MEQVQLPYIEDCDHEDKEVSFPFLKEYDYPSICTIQEIDHLENEDVEDLFEGSQITSDNFSKEYHLENINSFEFIIA